MNECILNVHTYTLKMGQSGFHVANDGELYKTIEDIKKKIPNFVYADEFKKHMNKIHDELYSDNLEFLEPRYNELIKEREELDNEIKVTKEKLDKAKEKEAERKEIEEKQRKAKEKEEKEAKAKAEKDYNSKVSSASDFLLLLFEMSKKEAEGVVKELLASPEFRKQEIGAIGLAIKRGYKLKPDILLKARNDKKTYDSYKEDGYKFDFEFK